MTQYSCQLIPQTFQLLHAEMVVLLIQRVLGFLIKCTASRPTFQSVHSSHLASGTIPHMCTSVHHCQQDAVSLYENLSALLTHFTHSAKNMKILNAAYDILNRNIVHILNWECTRMAGFLDACVQSSGIIVPFLDTFLDSISLVNYKIQQDQTKFISGPKGKHLLQLFTDLHPVFTNRYLHWVDSDNVLICKFTMLLMKMPFYC